MYAYRTSFCGQHRGYIELRKTSRIWVTFSPTATHLEPMKTITPSVGTIKEPEPRFCSPRYSELLCYEAYHLIFIFSNNHFIFVYILVINCQGFLEKNIQELQLYKAHSDNYICSLVPGSPNFQAQYTPGLFYLDELISLTKSNTCIIAFL